MKPPTGLGKAAQKLWRWLDEGFELDGCEPMVMQLCELADRLAVVRTDLAKPGVSGVDRDRLIVTEIRLIGAYTRTWRALGLAHDDKGPPRGVGRPPESERRPAGR